MSEKERKTETCTTMRVYFTTVYLHLTLTALDIMASLLQCLFHPVGFTTDTTAGFTTVVHSSAFLSLCVTDRGNSLEDDRHLLLSPRPPHAHPMQMAKASSAAVCM